jgi:outer membrane protein assembly factor BamB
VVRVINAKADRFSMPFGIVTSGSHVWVMNNVQGDRITELNASNGSLVRIINPKAGVFDQPAFAASGSRVWVSNYDGNSIIELNASNGSLVRVIKDRALAGLASPDSIAVSGAHLWVTTNLKSVIELNASNGSLVRVINAKADGFEVMPTVYSFDDTHVWVMNTQSNSLTELNASNGSLVRLIK